ncbi:MAG: acyl-CoA thioesterase, partial [Candidatus Gastranaerophilales bacterium]|nr:acyl-CoA thioesterase [Candidatus Gastranaerophilales bacterium]
YYSDTDAYGVVWHGSYLRWLEKGRVLFCEDLGLNLVDLFKQNIVLPVTSINIKYKASAELNDNVTIRTKIVRRTVFSATFSQTVSDSETGKVFVQAEVDIVSVSNNGKLYRRFPDILDKAFKEDILCSV